MKTRNGIRLQVSDTCDTRETALFTGHRSRQGVWSLHRIRLLCFLAPLGIIGPPIAIGCDSKTDPEVGTTIRSTTEACNDGTSENDCCSNGVAEDTSCSQEGLECWMRCNAGTRVSLICTRGTWVGGKGPVACRASDLDAATPSKSPRISCNDGTGRTDCCSSDIVNSPCHEPEVECWTPCILWGNQGAHGYMQCKTDGMWRMSSGRDPLPCNADAQPIDD